MGARYPQTQLFSPRGITAGGRLPPPQHRRDLGIDFSSDTGNYVPATVIFFSLPDIPHEL
jgi:hypothetical protein